MSYLLFAASFAYAQDAEPESVEPESTESEPAEPEAPADAPEAPADAPEAEGPEPPPEPAPESPAKDPSPRADKNAAPPPERDAECPPSFDAQDVNGARSQAEEAFANLDPTAFADARDRLLGNIHCSTEALPSSAVAGFFEVRALNAHLKRDPESLKLSATAMAEIDATPPPSSVAPSGHPVRTAWKNARDRARTPTRALAVPNGGRIRVDGSDTLDFPVERPSLVQFVRTDGAIEWTKVVEPGANLPTYDEAPEDYRAKYENSIIVSTQRKPIELPILATVFGVGAVGTYIATTQTRKAFFAAENPSPGDLQALRNNNNALVFASAGLGAVALGLGTWTVLTW